LTAANCSPAVASRRAKYVDEFRVPTLLGTHQISHKKCLAADARLFSLWLFEVILICSRGEATTSQSVTRTLNFTFSLEAKSAEPPLKCSGFCSKLRAPHRGTFLGPFVFGANIPD
jgi:hypothetical protein